MPNPTNRQIIALTLIILLVLCALLVYSRAEGASVPVIYYAHDDAHRVGCWVTEQGGIFCMADPAQMLPDRRDGREDLASWEY